MKIEQGIITRGPQKRKRTKANEGIKRFFPKEEVGSEKKKKLNKKIYEQNNFFSHQCIKI